MSNNQSWKQYGGIGKINSFNNVAVGTIMADQFLSRSAKPTYQQYNGTLEVSVDFIADRNLISGNSVLVYGDSHIYGNSYIENKLFFGNASTLPDITNYAYMYGNSTNIGINTTSPKTVFNITGTISSVTDILTIESSNQYLRNIIAQNMNQRGVVVDANDSTSNIYFYNDVSTNKTNIPNSTIRYTTQGNLLLDTSNFITLSARNIQMNNSGGTLFMNSQKTSLDSSGWILFNSSGGFILTTSGGYVKLDSITGNAILNVSGDFLVNTSASGGYFLLNKNTATLSCSGSIFFNSSGGYIHMKSNNGIGNTYLQSNLTNITSYLTIQPPPLSTQITASGQIYNETLLIYDNSNNMNQYLPNVYDNSFISTGSAVTILAKDNSSNTYFRVVAPNKMGAALNGGIFPNDVTRPMASIGLNDICGNFIPSMMIVSGKNLSGNNDLNYASTIGINTYSPKTEQYSLDINGPTRIGNGEINTVFNASFETKKMRFSRSYNNYGIMCGAPSVTLNRQCIVYTSSYGKTWTPSIISNDQFDPINQFVSNNSLVLGIYDLSYAMIGNYNNLVYYTNNGGINWYPLYFGTDTNINSNATDTTATKTITSISFAINGLYLKIFITYTNSTTTTSYWLRTFDVLITALSSTFNGISSGDSLRLLSNQYTDTAFSFNINASDCSGSFIYFAGDSGVLRYGVNTLSVNESRNNRNNIKYNDIYTYSDDYVIAVGYNSLTYTSNSGATWVNITTNQNSFANIQSLSNVNLKGVFIYDLSYATAVGDNGVFIYTNNGSESQYWNAVPNAVLNTNGVANQINGTKYYLTSIVMSNLNTFIISQVDNSLNITNNTVTQNGSSRIQNLYLPNLMNRKSNRVLDVSGNMAISGDIFVIDSGKLNVHGDVSFNTRLFVCSDVSLNARLSVAGDVSLNTRLFIAGDLSINGRICAASDVSFNSRLFIAGDLSINGRIRASSDVSFNNRLFVSADVSFNKNAYIWGNLSFPESPRIFVNFIDSARFSVVNDGSYSTSVINIGGMTRYTNIGTTDAIRRTSAVSDLSSGSVINIGAVAPTDYNNIATINIGNYSTHIPADSVVMIASIISGSSEVPLPTISNLNVGDYVTGLGIPYNTTIASFPSTTTTTATGAITNLSSIVTLTTAITSSISAGSFITAGYGIPYGTTVSITAAQGSTSITMSNTATATVSSQTFTFLTIPGTTISNCSIISGTNTIYLQSTSGVSVGATVSGTTALPSGNYVTAIPSNNVVSVPCATTTNSTTIYLTDITGISIGQIVKGISVTNNVTNLNDTSIISSNTIITSGPSTNIILVNNVAITKTTDSSGLSNNYTFTVSSTTGIVVGALVTGSGIAASTTVTSISGTTITINNPITLTVSSQTISFTIYSITINNAVLKTNSAQYLSFTAQTTLQTTGNFNSGTNIITNIPSTSSIYIGSTVYGTGIPLGTTVSSINSTSQITISSNTTTSGTGSSIIFNIYSITVSIAATATVTQQSITFAGAKITLTNAATLTNSATKITFNRTKPDVYANYVNIGNGLDQVKLSGQSVYLTSNEPLYSTNPLLILNHYSNGIGTSAKSGLYIEDNFDTTAGYVRVASNLNGFNFKAPNNNTATAYNQITNNVLNIDVNSMTLQGNSIEKKFNAPIGINGISNGIVTLTRSKDAGINLNPTNLDSDYTLTVTQIDTSNVLIRDSLSSDDYYLQSILTKFSVTQDVSMNNRLFVCNDTSLNARLGVAGDTSLNSRLFVSNDVSFNSRLFVANDVSMNSRLFVFGDISFNSNVYIRKDLTITGRLNVYSYAKETTITTVVISNYTTLQIDEDLSLNGRLYLNADGSMNLRLFVASDVSLNARLGVAGDVSLNSRLFVSADVSFNSRLYVANDVSFNSRLFVNNDVSLNARLCVAGDVSFNSRLFVASDVSLNSRLNVGADVSFNARLFVSGDVSLNGRLYVASNAGFGISGSIYKVDVLGTTNLRGPLNPYTLIDDTLLYSNAQPLDFSNNFAKFWLNGIVFNKNTNNTSLNSSRATLTENWGCSTMSVNGKYIVFGSSNATGKGALGNLYLSQDFGNTMTDISNNINIQSSAISANGQYIAFTNILNNAGAGITVSTTNTSIFISTDYGQKFTAGYTNSSYSTSSSFPSIAMSATGQYISATSNSDTVNFNTMLISSNYGSSFQLNNPITINPSYSIWNFIAMNANGQYQIATTYPNSTNTTTGNYVWLSTNYGINWTSITMTEGNVSGTWQSTYWQDCAISATGQYQTVVSSNVYTSSNPSPNGVGKGFIWTSSNYGTNWKENSSSLTDTFYKVNMSTDGQQQIIITSTSTGITYGITYVSTNYGVNWSKTSYTSPLTDVNISGNGQFLSLLSPGSKINISTTPNLPSFAISNSLFVGADVSFNSRLFVGGDVSLNARLFVIGDVSLNSRLFIANDVSLNARLCVAGDVSFNSRLFVTSDVSLNARLGVFGDVSFSSRLFVANDVSLNARMCVAGDVSFNSRLFLTSDASLNARLGVIGDVSFNSRLFVNNDVSLNARLCVAGDVSFNSRLFLTSDASLNARLGVIGDVSFNSRLFVNNDVSLNARLCVGGDASFNRRFFVAGDVSFNSRLYVANDVSFSSRLFVGTDVSLNSRLYIASIVGIATSSPTTILDISNGSQYFGVSILNQTTNQTALNGYYSIPTQTTFTDYQVYIDLHTSTNSGTNYSFKYNNNTIGARIGSGQQYITSTNAIPIMTFNLLNGSTGAKEYMRLNTYGLGIGTDASAILHLSNQTNRGLNGKTTQMLMTDITQGLNSKTWSLSVTGGSLIGAVYDDANSASQNWLQVARSVNTISSVTFPNGTFNITKDLAIGGTLSVTSTSTLTGATYFGAGVNLISSTGYFGFNSIRNTTAFTTMPILNGFGPGNTVGGSPTSTNTDLAIYSYYGIAFINSSATTNNCSIYFDLRSGQINSTTFYASSDYRIKDKIIPLGDRFVVDNLKPVHYYNKNSKKNDIGFIAHEVQEYFPDLVSGKKDGVSMQSINYNGLIGILVKEVKDLKHELNKMKTNERIYCFLFAIVFTFMLSFVQP